MKLPDGNTIGAGELAEALRTTADMLIKTDGDRDEGNPSGLKVFQVQAAFRLMILAADKLEGPARSLGRTPWTQDHPQVPTKTQGGTGGGA